jgi:hypothetical protein
MVGNGQRETLSWVGAWGGFNVGKVDRQRKGGREGASKVKGRNCAPAQGAQRAAHISVRVPSQQGRRTAAFQVALAWLGFQCLRSIPAPTRARLG